MAGSTVKSMVISGGLPAGETVAFNAVAPLRLKIGNVRGTELSFRGKSVDLAPVNRDNIASFTLPTP